MPTPTEEEDVQEKVVNAAVAAPQNAAAVAAAEGAAESVGGIGGARAVH
jgi:hypothetical protein